MTVGGGGERNRGEKTGDGFGRKGDFGDTAGDDADDGARADGDENEVTREEFLVKMIGQDAATIGSAKSIGRYYLIKHSVIIAQYIMTCFWGMIEKLL